MEQPAEMSKKSMADQVDLPGLAALAVDIAIPQSQPFSENAENRPFIALPRCDWHDCRI
jgi:hypothetical protein